MAVFREWRAEIRRARKGEYLDYLAAAGPASHVVTPRDRLAPKRTDFYAASVGELWTTALRLAGVPAAQRRGATQPPAVTACASPAARWVDRVRLSAPR